jgi:hypothetical protein
VCCGGLWTWLLYENWPCHKFQNWWKNRKGIIQIKEGKEEKKRK